MKLIGLADCNNFYCSCERVFHPDLVGKPVVVLSNNDGCIIARSEESKHLGFKMGDVFYQVKDKLEQHQVAVFSSNYNLYGDMSRRVMSLLSRYTQQIEIYSIDEAFLDLSGMGTSDQLISYTQNMVKAIHRGTGIPISLGIAPTRTLAKMASKFAKKHKSYHGVCIIDNDIKRVKALRLFPIEDVWGIGHRHVDELHYHGIHTAWDLIQKSESWIKAKLTITGVRTWKELQGINCIDVEKLPFNKSICTSRSFAGKGLNKLCDIEEAMANFAAHCSRKLKEQNSVCQGLTFFAHTSRFQEDYHPSYIQQNIQLQTPTNDTQELVSNTVKSLRLVWKNEEYWYKKAGVIAWNICKDEAIQGNLFDSIDRTKQANLAKAVEEINRKNGHNTLRIAVQGYGNGWDLKREYISKQYTTNIRDIITLHVK